MALFNLVVMVVDKLNLESEFKDTKQPKTGDVVEVLPAGVFLGNAIYQDDHNFWRVLQVDITQAEAEALKTREAGDPKVDLMLQFRHFFLNLTSLSPATQAAITLNPKAPIPVTITELRAAVTARPKRTPIAVIG